jgi:bacillithiol synthase
MTAIERSAGGIVELERWVALHPASLAYAAGTLSVPAATGPARPRSPALAAALAAANERWANPVADEIDRWRAGAKAIVTGQQPGLLGGPLLTLIKASAVAAEVRRRRAAGEDAVGFLWLATADDDLAEMGWARLVAGEELIEAREESWSRGGGLAGSALLGTACATSIARLGELPAGSHGREAAELASECYRAGAPLGEATARFLARVLRGTGVVIVDALEPEIARAAADVVTTILARLPQVTEALRAGERLMLEHGWPLPFPLAPQRLPLFRLQQGGRQRLASRAGECPAALLAEIAAAPEQFTPNVWLRSLVQDAALGSATVLLGGGELAYHLQAAEAWNVVGLVRPEWRLRPHVTVVTAAERRLVSTLALEPGHLLTDRMPRHLLGGTGVHRGVERLRRSLERPLASLDEAVRAQLPALTGDLAATREKLLGAVGWLEQRATAAATRAAETDAARLRRVRAFLRPLGRPQERTLSVLAPVLRLGLDWGASLAGAIDPTHPGMHLLNWEEGGSW